MFSERLKIAMESRGKKPIDLAVGCNLSRGIISLYLSGKRQPKIETISKFANYLNVDIGFLLGFQDNLSGKEGKLTNALMPTKEEIIRNELLREIRVICSYEDNETLRTILSVVKTLAKNGNQK